MNRSKNRETAIGQVPVAHSCNPSYSGGRDQEDQEDWGSKPTPAKNSHKTLSWKNPTEKGLVD
jgi:hypothetical protein